MTISLPPSSVFYPASAGAVFDGTNDYISKATAIVANYDKGICSFWFNKSTGATNENFIAPISSVPLTSVLQLSISSFSRVLKAQVWKEGTDTLYEWSVQSFSAFENSHWHNVLWSWDAAAGLMTLAIDDVVNSVQTFPLNTNTGGAPTAWYIGASSTGSNKLNASLSEFYLTTDVYYDFSIVANRRKFISATKRPVFLGADSSIPTGSKPEIYFKGSGTGFNVNSGLGGNFTTTGTLTTPTTTPST